MQLRRPMATTFHLYNTIANFITACLNFHSPTTHRGQVVETLVGGSSAGVRVVPVATRVLQPVTLARLHDRGFSDGTLGSQGPSRLWDRLCGEFESDLENSGPQAALS